MKIFWMVVILFLSLMKPVWAEYTVTLEGKPVDLLGLTGEVRQLVPTVEGMHQQYQSIVFRRFTGEFTTDEIVLLEQSFTDHDAGESRQSREPVDIPIEQLPGIAAAAALAGMGGRKLFLRVREKRGA